MKHVYIHLKTQHIHNVTFLQACSQSSYLWGTLACTHRPMCNKGGHRRWRYRRDCVLELLEGWRLIQFEPQLHLLSYRLSFDAAPCLIFTAQLFLGRSLCRVHSDASTASERRGNIGQTERARWSLRFHAPSQELEQKNVKQGLKNRLLAFEIHFHSALIFRVVILWLE